MLWEMKKQHAIETRARKLRGTIEGVQMQGWATVNGSAFTQVAMHERLCDSYTSSVPEQDLYDI